MFYHDVCASLILFLFFDEQRYPMHSVDGHLLASWFFMVILNEKRSQRYSLDAHGETAFAIDVLHLGVCTPCLDQELYLLVHLPPSFRQTQFRPHVSDDAGESMAAVYHQPSLTPGLRDCSISSRSRLSFSSSSRSSLSSSSEGPSFTFSPTPSMKTRARARQS